MDSGWLPFPPAKGRGFSLIELVVVLAVLAVVAAVLVPNIMPLRSEGDVVAANTEVRNIRTAVTGYRAERNAFPEDSNQLSDYLQDYPRGYYRFDPANGMVLSASGWHYLVFDTSGQVWKEQR